MGDPILDQLDRVGVAYDVIACDPALADTAAFCEAYGYQLSESANTILVVGKADPRVYAACVVMADSRLDVNGVVRKRLGTRKASFASADETTDMTGMAIGGVTPFALPPSIEVWVDQRVADSERVVLGGGSRDRKILMRGADLAALPAVTHTGPLTK